MLEAELPPILSFSFRFHFFRFIFAVIYFFELILIISDFVAVSITPLLFPLVFCKSLLLFAFIFHSSFPSQSFLFSNIAHFGHTPSLFSFNQSLLSALSME